MKWNPAYERYVDIMYGWTLSSDWPRLAKVRALNSQWVYADPVAYDRPHIKAADVFLSGAEDGRNFRDEREESRGRDPRREAAADRQRRTLSAHGSARAVLPAVHCVLEDLATRHGAIRGC